MRQTLALPLLIAVFLPACNSHKMARSVDRAEAARPQETAEFVKAIQLPVSTSSHSLPVAMAMLPNPPAAGPFIAVQHKLQVASSDEKLQQAWDSVIRFCGTLQCEVTASSITARYGSSPASGNIALRVVPQDLPKLLTQVEKEGNIVQHSTLSEDKTTQVVDSEARIKNLTAYRDSLRAMLSRPALAIKDSVEIQEKLTDVQSDLDSQTTKRKILANETEKVAVEIEFRVKDAGSRRSPFAPLWTAVGEAAETLADSLGSLITFVVFVIPWMALLLLVAWLIRLLWRKRRGRKAALPATQVKS